MKKIIILNFVCFSVLAFSQVIIGDAAGTAPANKKKCVLLEFAANSGTNNNKGLLLPVVRTMPATPSEGTILVDASNASNARVKYYNANTVSGTNGWVDLSGASGDATSYLLDQPSGVDEGAAKSIIGSNSSSADGVLVLESATKAMILPIVSDVNNIPSPSAGMMVFVNKTGAKRLAVFNGSVWSFWKP